MMMTCKNLTPFHDKDNFQISAGKCPQPWLSGASTIAQIMTARKGNGRFLDGIPVVEAIDCEGDVDREHGQHLHPLRAHELPTPSLL